MSGMRPSGRLHLGHMHGVLDNWRQLQNQFECFFFVADWHALTTNYDRPWTIPASIDDMVLDWLAAGIDPQKATIFVQSDIKEHAELNLLLSMITPVSWLERNPTYKEQQQQLKERDLATFGFLGYPVLQAADIIMYKANKVPVGVDQLPHVELTREITRRFNYLYRDVFPVPEAMLTEVPKLPGLDGRKMSKSYGNSIYLNDSEEDVARRISTMVTDVERPRKSDPGDPANRCVAFNLHRLYMEKSRLAEIEADCKAARIGCVVCKKELARAVNSAMEPLRERRREFAADPGTVKRILAEGAEKAREVARNTMEEVRQVLFAGPAGSGGKNDAGDKE